MIKSKMPFAFIYTLHAFLGWVALSLIGILRTGMLCGPVIWDFRTLFNIETRGAQSQENV